MKSNWAKQMKQLNNTINIHTPHIYTHHDTHIISINMSDDEVDGVEDGNETIIQWVV